MAVERLLNVQSSQGLREGCSRALHEPLRDAGNWDELARPDMLGPAESACLKERHEAGQLYFE